VIQKTHLLQKGTHVTQKDDVGCAKRRRVVKFVSDLNRRFAHQALYGGQNPTSTTVFYQAVCCVGFRTPYIHIMRKVRYIITCR